MLTHNRRCVWVTANKNVQFDPQTTKFTSLTFSKLLISIAIGLDVVTCYTSSFLKFAIIFEYNHQQVKSEYNKWILHLNYVSQH